MGGQTWVMFALAGSSAILAALVPGVLDTPALATDMPPAVALFGKPLMAASIVKVLVPADGTKVSVDIYAKAVPTRQALPVSGLIRGRIQIPVGCERLVSPLVKSAAASTLGRCLT